VWLLSSFGASIYDGDWRLAAHGHQPPVSLDRSSSTVDLQRVKTHDSKEEKGRTLLSLVSESSHKRFQTWMLYCDEQLCQKPRQRLLALPHKTWKPDLSERQTRQRHPPSYFQRYQPTAVNVQPFYRRHS
jgi:hypothetical protein